jgi:hypothetical protein
MKGQGGGRPTKPDGQKRNRNKPTHGYVQLPREGRKGAAPKPLLELSDLEKRLWRLLWATPESTQWGPGDVPAVTRMVQLQANPDTPRDSRLLAEVRNLEDRFCLNPYSRRINKWELEPEDAPAELAEVSSLDRYQFDQAG